MVIQGTRFKHWAPLAVLVAYFLGSIVQVVQKELQANTFVLYNCQLCQMNPLLYDMEEVSIEKNDS